MKKSMIQWMVGGLVAALAVGTAIAQTAAVGPAVKPGAVIKKAGTPPPKSTTKTTTAGTGSVKISTANSATDDDGVWSEKIDIDGDGNVDETKLVWDDEDGVLFASKEGTFTCKNGATGDGGILIGINEKGNPRKRPAGSGFWIAEVDKSECGSQTAGLWGCKFDATGKETACGTATLDEKNDDVVIVAAKM